MLNLIATGTYKGPKYLTKLVNQGFFICLSNIFGLDKGSLVKFGDKSLINQASLEPYRGKKKPSGQIFGRAKTTKPPGRTNKLRNWYHVLSLE